jgi:phosphatidate cytidylyltransferase
MNVSLSSLQQRLLTAIVLAFLFFGCLWAGPVAFTLFIIVAAVLAVKEWFCMVRGALWSVSAKLFWGFTGLCYMALGFLGLFLVYHRWHAGLKGLVAVFLVIWATDSGAFFSGRFFKGPRLAPAISPGKTWSGAIGGLLCAVLVACVLRFFNFAFHDTQSLWAVMCMGAGIAIAAILGDLLESYAKRKTGVKDSGALFPGHGGVLDRLDSPLGVGVFIFFFLGLSGFLT